MKRFLSLLMVVCFFAGIAIPASAASYRYEDLKYDIVHHPYITPDEMIDDDGEWVTGILGHANYCTIEHKFFATNSPKCPYCGEIGWIGEKMPSDSNQALGVYFYDNAITVKISGIADCPACGWDCSLADYLNVRDLLTAGSGKENCKCGRRWHEENVRILIASWCQASGMRRLPYNFSAKYAGYTDEELAEMGYHPGYINSNDIKNILDEIAADKDEINEQKEFKNEYYVCDADGSGGLSWWQIIVNWFKSLFSWLFK